MENAEGEPFCEKFTKAKHKKILMKCCRSDFSVHAKNKILTMQYLNNVNSKSEGCTV